MGLRQSKGQGENLHATAATGLINQLLINHKPRNLAKRCGHLRGKERTLRLLDIDKGITVFKISHNSKVF